MTDHTELLALRAKVRALESDVRMLEEARFAYFRAGYSAGGLRAADCGEDCGTALQHYHAERGRMWRGYEHV